MSWARSIIINEAAVIIKCENNNPINKEKSLTHEAEFNCVGLRGGGCRGVLWMLVSLIHTGNFKCFCVGWRESVKVNFSRSL